jgi:hypothetical protein
VGIAPTGEEYEATGIVIHRIVGGKIAEEWSEGSGILELTRQRLEKEIRERERVEQELSVARRIQQASLPKSLPALAGWGDRTPLPTCTRGRWRLLRCPRAGKRPVRPRGRGRNGHGRAGGSRYGHNLRRATRRRQLFEIAR